MHQLQRGIVATVPADQTIRPTADGLLSDFTASAGQKYECVDEEVANGDTDYVYRVDSPSGQTFSNLPTLPTGTILGVSVCATGEYITGVAQINPRLRVNGTNYDDPTPNNATTSYIEYCNEWTTNPNTSAAWVKEDVEGTGSNPLQNWGWYSNQIDAGETIRVTQVYLVVRYN